MTIDLRNNRAANKSGLKKWTAEKTELDLTGGNVADAFLVTGGPCRIIAMFLLITEACENKLCSMSWVLDSDAGGDRVIGNTVNIANAALGDYFVAELDGTNIIKVTTGSSLIHGYFYETSDTNGTIVPCGGIDVILSATLSSGAGTLWIYYKPLVFNACITAQ